MGSKPGHKTTCIVFSGNLGIFLVMVYKISVNAPINKVGHDLFLFRIN